MLTHLHLRQRIAAFWTTRAHAEVPGIALVPQNDPTTLFTGSGMQQFVPNLMGETHPAGTRIWNIQRCVRAQDIEEVGDNRHDTFFEMVGNWSLGDYFKSEQLPWMFDLYTNRDYGFGLDPARLYVSVFGGSHGMSKDEESIAIWQGIFGKLGMKCEVGTADTWHPDQRITLYDAKKNWWSRAGTPDQMPAGEIGGPDSELFYDFGVEFEDLSVDPGRHPNSDSGRFIEIGNSVFIQYIKQADGSLKELPKRNVDFGGGFERILAAVNGNPDVFLTDVFAPVIQSFGVSYKGNERQLRIISDHIRTATHMAADGIMPGPKEQGYVMRRLIRRAVRGAQSLHIQPEQLKKAVTATVSIFKDAYPPINDSSVPTIVIEEIEKYLQTLENGKKIIGKFVKHQANVSGKDLFDLYQSTGVPAEEVAEIARELGATVTTEGLEDAKRAHADASRGASEQKFKGGLADSSEQVVKYHTATHLINQALTDIVSPNIRQEGSNITGERLRFDFSAPEKPTPEQIEQIAKVINNKIKESLPVQFTMMPKEAALSLGAKAFFRDKYPDEVKVYTVGGKPIRDAVGNWKLEIGNYSIELCGGPHVTNTSEIGPIEIYKVEKIGKGIFRLYARSVV